MKIKEIKQEISSRRDDLLPLKNLSLEDQEKALRRMFKIKEDDFTSALRVLRYLQGHAIIAGAAENAHMLWVTERHINSIYNLYKDGK